MVTLRTKEPPLHRHAAQRYRLADVARKRAAARTSTVSPASDRPRLLAEASEREAQLMKLRSGLLAASVAMVGAVDGTDAVRSEDGPAATDPQGSSRELTGVERERLREEALARAPELRGDSVSEFFALTRAEQSQVLAAAGLRDPGGSLADRDVQQYLLGQWYASGGRRVEAAKRILLSDLAPLSEASAALRALDLTDFAPSEAEISDTQIATGLERDEAAYRAGWQNMARHARPLLARLDPEYLGMWIRGDHRGLSGSRESLRTSLNVRTRSCREAATPPGAPGDSLCNPPVTLSGS